ncbi:MAG: DUF4435 domain-containing protein [Bacteroides sp.]
MPTTLRDNLTSAYIDAANHLAPKKARKRIVAYVESYDDIAFWRSILSSYENDERYFQVMLPSQTTLSKGKKMVLMNALDSQALGSSLLACVDSDYDYLLQDATTTSRKLNSNPYILQTYAYAIENYQCYAEGLHEVCVLATLNDRQVIDFADFLRRYSETIYPLFLWNIWFYRNHDTHTFPMADFNGVTRLQDVSAAHPERALEQLATRVRKKLNWLKSKCHSQRRGVELLGLQLGSLGLRPQNTYLFVQGHHLMDNVVLKLLIPICTQLRREREQEIKRLARHEEQFRNELTGYENCLASPELMLRKNDRYKNLDLYQRVCHDLEQCLDKQE